ncbi:methenyltetrahydromethanopterin cyclohydrolase [Candidatus Bathyarchaeota archaeon]|nr:methenyltetrahydromethanopterin cyclohydrolase [Candidatus Bathyarchaeota archaeon]
MLQVSVNQRAMKLVREFCAKAETYRVKVKKSKKGASIIDAGLETIGSIEAGRIITEICLGGLGQAKISTIQIGSKSLPSISVSTDFPAVSTLGSQMAGWQIKSKDFQALGSGPARALALKPKSIFEQIDYKDTYDEAVLVLETSKELPEDTIANIAELCRVDVGKLFLVVVPITSISGITQVSGRVVETGIHKLVNMGVDPKCILHARGSAPVLPAHHDPVEAMGRSNDAILYGGETYIVLNYDDEAELKRLTEKSVSSTSKQYGKSFAEILKKAEFDFYKIDPQLFAPAVMTVENKRTGRTFSAGKINSDVLLKTISL